MVTVSIDVAAANGVVANLRAFVNTVLDEWNGVGLVAQRGLCSTASLRGLSDPLDEMLRLSGELSTRVELAVTYNTGDKGRLPTENVLTYEVSDDTLAGVKAQLGIELAEGVQRLEPGGNMLHREDVERFEYFTTLMEKYSADSAVTDAMFNKLGPEGVVQVPIILKDFADAYQRDLMYMSEGDVMWDDNTHIVQRISDLQQRFMESFGAGLATSTKSDGFRSTNPNFAKDLAAAATRTPSGQGWGLSQVLRFGNYEPGFLTTLGTELYDWEKDQNGAVWGPQLDSQVMSWRLGTDDKGGHYDPFVGLFEAMGRTPKASLDFFNPDGGGSAAQERAKYFITDRTWRADDFNALGLALDAASTAFHQPGVSVDLQERSAWMASATISYLADRDPGMHDRRIGDAGKDSLAHILATYIYDVDRIAGGADGGLGTFPSNDNAPWDHGLPIGADFAKSDLIAVLNETLTDKGAAAQLGRATAAWNGYRIAIAAKEWGGEGSDTARLQAAVNEGGRLTGFVLGAMDTGVTGEAKSADERAQTYIDLASSVVGLIPTGGTFTSFLADQALSAGGDALSDQFTGNESRVKDEQHTVQEVALTDLQIAVSVALAEEGKLPSGALTNESGVTYPWFKGGQFNADSLADPSVRNGFISWMNSGEGGEDLTGMLPHILAEFAQGLTRGSGGAR